MGEALIEEILKRRELKKKKEVRREERRKPLFSSFLLKADEKELEQMRRKAGRGPLKAGIFFPEDVARVLRALRSAFPDLSTSKLVVRLLRDSFMQDPGLRRLYLVLANPSAKKAKRRTPRRP